MTQGASQKFFRAVENRNWLNAACSSRWKMHEAKVFSYLDGCNKRKRLHSSLGNRIRLEFEADLKKKEPEKKAVWGQLFLDHMTFICLKTCVAVDNIHRRLPIFHHEEKELTEEGIDRSRIARSAQPRAVTDLGRVSYSGRPAARLMRW